MFYTIALPLLIVLGILSALSALVILLSCRCTPGRKLTAGWMKNPLYQRFFKKHCRLWWVFWALVVVHAIIAYLYLF